MTFSPIGVIHTPHKEVAGTPIQPVFSQGAKGTVEVFAEYRNGLQDLEGFSHIILMYYFHASEGYSLLCRPFLDTRQRGVFATRAPKRPNPIGLSIVELVGIAEGVLTVSSADMLDGTPLLDIKPYIEPFDVRQETKAGWYDQAQNNTQTLADDRFVHNKNRRIT